MALAQTIVLLDKDCILAEREWRKSAGNFSYPCQLAREILHFKLAAKTTPGNLEVLVEDIERLTGELDEYDILMLCSQLGFGQWQAWVDKTRGVRGTFVIVDE